MHIGVWDPAFALAPASSPIQSGGTPAPASPPKGRPDGAGISMSGLLLWRSRCTCCVRFGTPKTQNTFHKVCNIGKFKTMFLLRFAALDALHKTYLQRFSAGKVSGGFAQDITFKDLLGTLIESYTQDFVMDDYSWEMDWNFIQTTPSWGDVAIIWQTLPIRPS